MRALQLQEEQHARADHNNERYKNRDKNSCEHEISPLRLHALIEPLHELLARRNEHHHGDETHHNHDGEVVLVAHLVVVGSNESGEVVTEEARQEPHAHEHTHHACRGYLRDHSLSDWRQIQLTDREQQHHTRYPDHVDLVSPLRKTRNEHHAQEGDCHPAATDGHLHDRARFFVLRALLCPNAIEKGRKQDDEEWIEHLEPRRWNVDTKNTPVRFFIGPYLQCIPLLLVHTPEEDVYEAEVPDNNQWTHPARTAGLFFFSCSLDDVLVVLREVLATHPIDHGSDEHADAGGGEAVVPAYFLSERTAYNRREERAKVHTHVVDRVGAVDALIAGLIERADLCCEVRLKHPVACDKEEQRNQEEALKCHQEVSDSHEHCTHVDCVRLTQVAVGHQATNKWREVHEARVESVDLRRHTNHREIAEERLQEPFKRRETDHARRERWIEQQVLRHVQHQQCSHAIEAEAFPHFGEEQVRQTNGVTQELSRGRRHGRT